MIKDKIFHKFINANGDTVQIVDRDYRAICIKILVSTSNERIGERDWVSIDCPYVKSLKPIEEEQNNNGWVSVEERLPENEVLCCNECGYMLVGYIFKDEYSNTGYNAESDNEFIQNVVAWMPLPTPYKKEK